MSLYVKGDRIRSMDELLRMQMIYSGEDLMDRPTWGSWPIKYADAMIRGKQLYKACRKQEQTADRDYMSTESVVGRYIHNLEKRMESHKKAIDELGKMKELFEKIQDFAREGRKWAN